jgi:hypothetical protein
MDLSKTDNFGELLAALSGSGLVNNSDMNRQSFLNSNSTNQQFTPVAQTQTNSNFSQTGFTNSNQINPVPINPMPVNPMNQINQNGLQINQNVPNQNIPNQFNSYPQQPPTTYLQPQYVWQAAPTPPYTLSAAENFQNQNLSQNQTFYSSQMQPQLQTPSNYIQNQMSHQSNIKNVLPQSQQSMLVNGLQLPMQQSMQQSMQSMQQKPEIQNGHTSKKSFPILFITILFIIIGFSVLAIWYYSKKNFLETLVPTNNVNLKQEVDTTTEKLPPPKLFLVTDQEENEKLLDSHVIENLEKYLSSPPAVLDLELESQKNSNSKTALSNTNKLNESSLNQNYNFKDQTSKPSLTLNTNSSKHKSVQNRFTKLSEVVAEDEDDEASEEIEVEVNGFKKKMPRRIDSDSPEISEFIKRREQTEKENLKWIESQRQNPHLNEDT